MIVALPRRRRRMITAPANSNTAPRQPAAPGPARARAQRARSGRRQPGNSRAPMALRARGLKSSTHREVAPPIPASFSLGTNSFMLPATRKTTARIPAPIHRARFSLRFIGSPWSAIGDSRYPDIQAVLTSPRQFRPTQGSYDRQGHIHRPRRRNPGSTEVRVHFLRRYHRSSIPAAGRVAAWPQSAAPAHTCHTTTSATSTHTAPASLGQKRASTLPLPPGDAARLSARHRRGDRPDRPRWSRRRGRLGGQGGSGAARLGGHPA